MYSTLYKHIEDRDKRDSQNHNTSVRVSEYTQIAIIEIPVSTVRHSKGVLDLVISPCVRRVRHPSASPCRVWVSRACHARVSQTRRPPRGSRQVSRVRKGRIFVCSPELIFGKQTSSRLFFSKLAREICALS